jgi:hypothetical protein
MFWARVAGGEAATRARARLQQRGLTEDALRIAERELERVGTIADAPSLPLGPTPEDQRAAEDALWGWYLEWSAIARAVIRDSNLLRALGYGIRRRSSIEEEVEEEEMELEAMAATDHPPLRAVPAAK